ncbi:MAG TPA: hypothetical protein VEG42_05845 [Thermoplasmata archaeon]|nr:hypothetical protein [Thermoplasmata archaeon]
MSSAHRHVPFAGAVAFFRRHPILLFLALTPGIPEYLSGSSPVAYVVLSPILFLIFLALNLGLYGPGVLLVREAFVRWKPGWGGLVLLGAAYGILEEGTALSTLFDPQSKVVSGLGTYGHYAGVSWVWAVGVLAVHIVLSVALPIVLFGLALPEMRGRSLLTGRQVPLAAAVYAVDIFLLVLIANYWRQAPGLLLAGAVVALLLYAAARALPKGTLDPRSPGPRLSAKWFFPIGLAYFPVLLLVPAFGERAGAAPVVTMLVDLLLGAGLFFLVRREIGRAHNEAAWTMLALGVLVPIMLFGFVAQVFVPVVLVLDVIVGLFFFTLWRRYGPGSVVARTESPPVGAM